MLTNYEWELSNECEDDPDDWTNSTLETYGL